MAAAPIPYLKSYLNIQNPLLQNTRSPIAWVGYSAVFGVFSYYAPKTFKLTSVGILAGSILWFNKLVLIFNDQRAAELRSWMIQACQVMWSVGVVFGANGIYSLSLSAKMLKEMRILNGLSSAVLGILGMVVLAVASPFWERAKHLSQRARWIQMEDYLNYPSLLRDELSENFVNKSIFFIAAFFPGLMKNLPHIHPILIQFCLAQSKNPRLISFFSACSKIPTQGLSNWKRWVIAIHQLEDVINQNVVSDKLKNALRPIAENSEQAQIDQLPDTAKKFFNDLRSESAPPTE